jgi:hypothetical protein
MGVVNRTGADHALRWTLRDVPSGSAVRLIIISGRREMTHILAIDQSTSATKAVLFDPAGRVVDRTSRDHRQIYPQPGWVEHDAEEIWQNVLAVIGEIVGRQREKLADATGLRLRIGETSSSSIGNLAGRSTTR